MAARPSRQILDLAVDTLASYRLTKLIRDDLITEPLRETVYSRFGRPDESRVSYLVNCPWCMSIWLGLVLAVAHRQAPAAADVVTRALALSALTGLLHQQTSAPST
jgi:Protein of unknown function (DUF1360)